jgi:hypothetical protein
MPTPTTKHGWRRFTAPGHTPYPGTGYACGWLSARHSLRAPKAAFNFFIHTIVGNVRGESPAIYSPGLATTAPLHRFSPKPNVPSFFFLYKNNQRRRRSPATGRRPRRQTADREAQRGYAGSLLSLRSPPPPARVSVGTPLSDVHGEYLYSDETRMAPAAGRGLGWGRPDEVWVRTVAAAWVRTARMDGWMWLRDERMALVRGWKSQDRSNLPLRRGKTAHNLGGDPVGHHQDPRSPARAAGTSCPAVPWFRAPAPTSSSPTLTMMPKAHSFRLVVA